MKKVSSVTATVIGISGIVAGVLLTLLITGAIQMFGDKNISAQRAREIAYKKAGLSAEEVKPVKTGFDSENGQIVYDVEFYHNGTKYSAEISAADGNVISWESETEYRD